MEISYIANMTFAEYASMRDATIRRLGGTLAMEKRTPIHILKIYVAEHGQQTGTISWQMAEAALAALEIKDVYGNAINWKPCVSDDGESERCQHCGCLVDSVWYAPDEIWARVTGLTDLCAFCFNQMAEHAGILLYWECAEDHYPTLFGWIPITKELPLEGVPVLVWIGYAARVLYLRNDVWYYAYNGQTYGALCAVSHWMLLPGPPREEAAA